MISIGNLNNRLKKITWGPRAAIPLVFMLFSTSTWALERELASSEIQKLESNIRKDPLNATSGKFLIQHYSNKQQWKDLIRIAQPLQKTLDSVNALLLVEAYLAVGEGASAYTLLGHIQGTAGATAETKIWEARALTIMAKKEKTDIQRMNHANTAILVIREAAELDPKDEDVYIEWVDILRAFWPHFAQDALHVVKTMEQKTEDYESHIPLKCELFTKASLWDQGAVACQRAIRTNPKDVMSALYLAEVQNVKVGPEEKKKLLVKLAKDYPAHYEVQSELAELYFEEQDFVSATAQYKKVIELKPDEVANILRLAQSEFKTKQFAAALATYKKHCKNARMVASEFKDSTKQLRSDRNLHKQYSDAMLSCR